MADWPELKAILLPFPCLWDPQDPYYLDKTVKAVCREQVLEIYNQRSSVPIDTKSLNQWIAENHKQLTPTLQTASEELPITTLPQELPATTLPQELPVTTLPQELPVTTLPQEFPVTTLPQELPVTTLPQELPVTTLPQELPVTTLPQQLSVTTLPQSPSIVAECMPQEITATRILPITTSCQSELSKLGGNTAGGRPKLQDLVKEFPCLWDCKDLNYKDNVMRKRSMKLLLQKFNRLSSIEITMDDLRRKRNALVKRIHRVETGKSKFSSATSLLNHRKAPHGKPKLQDLVKEFPCLWNPKDLNYKDNVMRKRCKKLLLQKFNSLSSTEITMEDLNRKMTALLKSLHRVATGKSNSSSATSLLNYGNRNQETVATHRMPKLQDLVKEFPCLWDCEDLNYKDNVVRKRCMELLLQKFNRLSSTEITKVDLKRKLNNLLKRLHKVEARNVQEVSEGQLETAGGEEEVQEITADNFRALFDNPQTDPQASIDSTNSSQLPQDGHNQEALVLQGRCIEILFNYCRFCGELKNSSDTNDINTYVANNKCTLIINDLRAELEFTDDILPRNICKDCERKFQEMVDFVKCVKDAQVKLNGFNNETLHRRRNNENSLAENCTESEKEADSQRKRCKVTVGMNSNELQSLSDNNVENNDIQMNNYDETGSFLQIVAESEQRDGSGVPINESAPSLSLNNGNNGNTNSISHCQPAETATTYITTWADFLKNKPLNEKIYVKATPLSQNTHHRNKDFEDVNGIDLKKEYDIADEYINDKQKQLND